MRASGDVRLNNYEYRLTFKVHSVITECLESEEMIKDSELLSELSGGTRGILKPIWTFVNSDENTDDALITTESLNEGHNGLRYEELCSLNELYMPQGLFPLV